VSADEDALPIVPLQPEALLAVLVEHAVDFVVIGGFSLAAHGVIRGTKDIDIVPEPSSSNLGRLADALRTRSPAPAWCASPALTISLR
jgi:hypothetical protein